MDMDKSPPLPSEEAGLAMPVTLCDGSSIERKFGSWQGHVGPGLMIAMWGVWTAYHTFTRYLASHDSGRRYSARAWYEGPTNALRLGEPLLKVLMAIFGLTMELYLDHDAYRYLYCPKDTMYAGRFANSHLNNWQHAGNYPGFLVSVGVPAGLVDIAGAYIPLPQAVSQVFLSLAFVIEAFLMSTHTKHVPLDSAVHHYLALTMIALALAALSEAAVPSNPMVSVSRCFFMLLEGGWLYMAGIILFESRVEWDPSYMGSTMICPVVYAMLALTVATMLLAFFVVLKLLSVRRARAAAGPAYARVGKDEDDVEARGFGPAAEMETFEDSAQDTGSEDDMAVSAPAMRLPARLAALTVDVPSRGAKRGHVA